MAQQRNRGSIAAQSCSWGLVEHQEARGLKEIQQAEKEAQEAAKKTAIEAAEIAEIEAACAALEAAERASDPASPKETPKKGKARGKGKGKAAVGGNWTCDGVKEALLSRVGQLGHEAREEAGRLFGAVRPAFEGFIEGGGFVYVDGGNQVLKIVPLEPCNRHVTDT